MTKTAMPRLRAWVPWGAAIAACLLAIVLIYPGLYPFDSAHQLWQARSRQFSNHSPVSMTALWSVLLDVTGNPASLLCLNLAMFWAGLALCVMVIARTITVRLVLLLVLGLMPLTLVEMAHLLSDAHLVALLVLATGLAGWGFARGRRAPLLACVLVLVYAGGIRHNALLAILPFGAIIVSAPAFGGRRDLRSASFAAVALGILSFSGAFALDRALTVQRVTAWPMIALWDLAAVSVDSGELLLPPFTHGPGLTVEELRVTGAFDPTANTYLWLRTRSGIRNWMAEPYSPGQLRELRGAWIDSALRHPAAYARHRMRTFWLLIGPHRGEFQGMTHFVQRVQYRDNPPLPAAFHPGLQQDFYAFAERLKPGWSFAALPYLLVGVMALVLGWVCRDRPVSRLAVAVSGSALLYAASYVVLAPSADLRYLTWPIVAGPIALALAMSSWRDPATRHH